MKKKLKDLIKEEQQEICNKQKRCWGCPLRIVPYLGNADIGCKWTDKHYIEEHPNEEIDL